MRIPESELILNPDGSIYHLNLLPEDISNTILIVGDPDRVIQVSNFFDTIDIKKEKREFITHTGWYNKKRITVLSTGIGTDNIDIVFNELDALVNIDLKKRKVKKELTSLEIVRVGTSGSIQPNIPLDSFVISKLAIGFDSLLHFYESKHVQLPHIQKAFCKATNWQVEKSEPYIVACDEGLANKLTSNKTINGFTGTNIGFYGPQSRILRLQTSDNDLNAKLAGFEYEGLKITNLEMETSGIYGLASLLGHKALSMNCIIANRPLGTFSSNPKKTINELIKYTLDKITA